jgi:hypothetical protein
MTSFALSIVTKATLVLLLMTLIAGRLARHTRASARHRLLAAGFGVLLLLPLASVALPVFHIDVTTPVLDAFIPESVPVDRVTPASGWPSSAQVVQRVSDGVSRSRSLVAAAYAAGALVFDIGLAVIDEQARQGNPRTDLLRMIHAAQIRAHLEDRVARANAEGAPSPGVC